MSGSLPAYGQFHERRKGPTKTIFVAARERYAAPPTIPPIAITIPNVKRPVMWTCCEARRLTFTGDKTSAICKACGTIMPGNWFTQEVGE